MLMSQIKSLKETNSLKIVSNKPMKIIPIINIVHTNKDMGEAGGQENSRKEINKMGEKKESIMDGGHNKAGDSIIHGTNTMDGEDIMDGTKENIIQDGAWDIHNGV